MKSQRKICFIGFDKTNRMKLKVKLEGILEFWYRDLEFHYIHGVQRYVG